MPKKLDTILFEALVEKNIIAKKELDALFKEADSSRENLHSLLVKRGLVLEKDILNIFAEKLKISCLDLKDISVNKYVIEKVPLKIASYYGFMPIGIKDRILTVAVSSPLDIKTQDEIRTQLGYEIEMVLSCQEDLLDALKKYYGIAPETLEKIVSDVSRVSDPTLETVPERVEDIEKLAEDVSVIKLVNQIILDAYRKRATDIHLEPYREKVSIRYRIDGLLYDTNVGSDIKNLLAAIISRIKIMSNLNIVERRLPQDGRAIVKVQNQTLDLRISTIPTPFGESVVIRILPAQMLFSLEKLGLSKKDMQIFEQLIQKPHGIIFVTGPTGSGKTTTLYTCLSRLNTKDHKIVTIEDPIEYEMSGITQIQVMPEIGLDFARGLRSMLRHDPDVMMVGEVRDLETAEIAIRVALTGHLVFSTLHTNDAASGITRLIDIGVEPYLIASSVEAFIAQRLIRLICPDCRYEDTAAPSELKELITHDLKLKSITEVKIYKGKGCSSCNFTGFFGRTAIYEILLVDEAIKDLILRKTSASQLKKLALSRGMKTLRQNGWEKIILGLTTPEEVMKVTSAEEDMDKENVSSWFNSSREEISYPMGSGMEFQKETPTTVRRTPQGAVRRTSCRTETSQGTQRVLSSPTLLADEVSCIEKRIYKRLDSKVNLRYRVFQSQGELVKRGFTSEQLTVTKNISAGGLLFFSNERLPIGSILELTLELPDGQEPIVCLARIVRIEEMEEKKNYGIGVGICFLDITGSHRARLNRYVEGMER